MKKYTLYQTKTGTYYSLFEMERYNIPIDLNNYNEVCSSELKDSETLEDIYSDLSIKLLKSGHSRWIGTSDIFVVEENGEKEMYYCNNFEFVKLQTNE